MTNKEMIKQIDGAIEQADINLKHFLYSEDKSGNMGRFDGLIGFYETTLKALRFQKKMLGIPSVEMLLSMVRKTDFTLEEKFMKLCYEIVVQQALKELETEDGE